MKTNTQIFIALLLAASSATAVESQSSRSAPSVARVSGGRTAQDVIREAKLKVLQRHYEETLGDLMKLDKAAISAKPEQLEKSQRQARALREYLSSVERQFEALVSHSTSTITPIGKDGSIEIHFTGEKKVATVVAKYVLVGIVAGITDRAERKAKWEQCLETLRKSAPVITSDSGDLPQWNLDSDNGVLVVRATREQQDVIGALIGDMKSKPSPSSPKP